MEQKYYYLASPFNGSKEQMAYRYAKSQQVAGALVQQGIPVFSPLLHNRPIAAQCQGASPEEIRAIIMPLCLTFVRNAQGVLLLTLPGWQQSRGVKDELELADQLNIPIYCVRPDDINDDMAHVLRNPIAFSQLHTTETQL